mmetsp:Transcript_2401/g.6021  ORF Transcript_2401/g.6021 Transcript_2401/m.6021 type:complete len:449 (+) Transcript_2401:472-1818(+)
MPRDVGDLDRRGGLLFPVATGEHRAEGVRRGAQRGAVRKKLAPLYQEAHVAKLAVVHVLVAQVHLGRGRRRLAHVDGRDRVGLGRQVKQRHGALLLRGVAAGLEHHVDEHLQAALAHKNLVQLLLAAGEARKRGGGALLHHLVVGAHHVEHLAQHLAAHLLLQPLERLLHAVLAGLHDEVAVDEALHAALADDVRDVVLVVREAVEREGRVVLQVAVARVHEVQQRLEPAGVDDARLVVRVLRQPAQRKGSHLAQLQVLRAQHHDQRRHRAALHDLGLEVGVRGRKLPQQQRRLALALGAAATQQADHRLQRALVQHLPLDRRRRVHEVADHAHRFVVDAAVLAAQHLDQRRQRVALHDLLLVVLVLEGQGAQRARRRALDLWVHRVEELHERRNAALGAHAALDDGVLVREVGDGVRRAAHHAPAARGAGRVRARGRRAVQQADETR